MQNNDSSLLKVHPGFYKIRENHGSKLVPPLAQDERKREKTDGLVFKEKESSSNILVHESSASSSSTDSNVNNVEYATNGNVPRLREVKVGCTARRKKRGQRTSSHV